MAMFFFQNRRISFYHHRNKRDSPEVPGDSNIRLPPVTGDSNLKMEARSDVGNKATLQQSPRQARGWCKDSHGVFCMLYNVFNGDKSKVHHYKLDDYLCLFEDK